MLKGFKKGKSSYPELNDSEWLNEKYWVDELTISEIAKIVGCSLPTVRYALKRLGIQIQTKSETYKGNKGMLGKYHSEETKKKMRDAHKGKKHLISPGGKRKIRKANKGKHPNETTRAKLRKASEGKNNFMFGKHHSEESKQKMGKARKHRRFPTHHTKPELIFEKICKKYGLPFRYTGDGSLWIGKKGEKQLNPDFTECNGKKIVVEIFGDYWHSPLFNRNMKEQGTLAYRKKHYKRFKWTPIFIWESDLMRGDVDAFVLMELKKKGVL